MRYSPNNKTLRLPDYDYDDDGGDGDAGVTPVMFTSTIYCTLVTDIT